MSNSQTKKSQYEIYPRLIDKLVQRIKKAEKTAVKANAVSILREFIDYDPSFVNKMDFLIMADEKFWEREGNHTIFPENTLVLDNLLKARFSIEKSIGFDLPFSSFILSLPQGYKVDGFPIPSCLVTWIEYEGAHEHTTYPFCDYLGVPRPRVIQKTVSGEGEYALRIMFRDRNDSFLYHRAVALESHLPAILRAKNTSQFLEILGTYQNTNLIKVIAPDDIDLNIQFRLFKLIAAIGVYNIATEGKKLQDGLPSSLSPKIIGKSPDMQLAMSTLSNHPAPKGAMNSANKESPEMHVRSWHFRELRDDRFYKGEHSHKPKGSRIIFIPETVVGGDVTPHTQSY
ncbi:hypothetical protein RYA05_05880 [Pseudomonas syringae pv. actinidiae]|nr:hypothetical protein [Pseudomonas syringae pv. actinidiae]